MKSNNNYTAEELAPVTLKLIKKYTGDHSSSVTYEKAEQLMGAVIYCINELSLDDNGALVSPVKLSACDAYEAGCRRVIKKVKAALILYEETLAGFSSYENTCLHDTFVKGMPEFFRWYDSEFEPQDTILTLDYPLLKDLSSYCGIDRIYEYIRCIRTEQMFLGIFPYDYVTGVLYRYNPGYRGLTENLCHIVFTSMICHMLAGRPLSEPIIESDCDRIENIMLHTDEKIIAEHLTSDIRAMADVRCKDSDAAAAYFAAGADDILCRLKAMAERHVTNVLLQIV